MEPNKESWPVYYKVTRGGSRPRQPDLSQTWEEAFVAQGLGENKVEGIMWSMKTGEIGRRGALGIPRGIPEPRWVTEIPKDQAVSLFGTAGEALQWIQDEYGDELYIVMGQWNNTYEIQFESPADLGKRGQVGPGGSQTVNRFHFHIDGIWDGDLKRIDSESQLRELEKERIIAAGKEGEVLEGELEKSMREKLAQIEGDSVFDQRAGRLWGEIIAPELVGMGLFEKIGEHDNLPGCGMAVKVRGGFKAMADPRFIEAACFVHEQIDRAWSGLVEGLDGNVHEGFNYAAGVVQRRGEEDVLFFVEPYPRSRGGATESKVVRMQAVREGGKLEERERNMRDVFRCRLIEQMMDLDPGGWEWGVEGRFAQEQVAGLIAAEFERQLE